MSNPEPTPIVPDHITVVDRWDSARHLARRICVEVKRNWTDEWTLLPEVEPGDLSMSVQTNEYNEFTFSRPYGLVRYPTDPINIGLHPSLKIRENQIVGKFVRVSWFENRTFVEQGHGLDYCEEVDTEDLPSFIQPETDVTFVRYIAFIGIIRDVKDTKEGSDIDVSPFLDQSYVDYTDYDEDGNAIPLDIHNIETGTQIFHAYGIEELFDRTKITRTLVETENAIINIPAFYTSFVDKVLDPTLYYRSRNRYIRGQYNTISTFDETDEANADRAFYIFSTRKIEDATVKHFTFVEDEEPTIEPSYDATLANGTCWTLCEYLKYLYELSDFNGITIQYEGLYPKVVKSAAEGETPLSWTPPNVEVFPFSEALNQTLDSIELVL
ncbi:hypothetical protein FACS1894170_10080 [Planctomycetales bacterium]|nr:hypothetical protein FACS1894170_10080 [Planctomycetales bacterium]